MLQRLGWCSISELTGLNSGNLCHKAMGGRIAAAPLVVAMFALNSCALAEADSKFVQRPSVRQFVLQPERTLTTTGPSLLGGVGIAVFH